MIPSRVSRLLVTVPRAASRSLVSTSSAAPISTPQLLTVENVQASLQQLRLDGSPFAAHLRHVKPEYKLPSFSPLHKNTKVDPLSNKQYELPTFSSAVLEKFTPSSTSKDVVIRDPHHLQHIVDRDGLDVIKQHCMPSMYKIRRLKMNKHRLKKCRKKNLFLARKLTRIKKAKKEAEMLEFEATCRKKGEDFSAEKYVDEKLDAAREGGWHIDIWKEYRQRKQPSN